MSTKTITQGNEIRKLTSQVHALESDMSKILEAAKIDCTVITKLNDKIAKLQSGLKSATNTVVELNQLNKIAIIL